MRPLAGRERLLLLAGAVLLASAVLALPTTAPPATAPSRDLLARIRQSGVLRVGTTGDYDPFSLVDAQGNYRGIDIEAARLLARAIEPNVRVRFVKTSWPTMTADLRAGKFDLAMSGVSRNRQRRDAGALSRSYLLDAKVALLRAADRGKYRTLADLDRPGVTVLVNPGGTNQQFVQANIRRAKVVVIPNNLSIPALIAEGRGDVMFTDGIEARVHARRDPRLGVALTDPPLLPVEKVYYLPKGCPALLAVVNAWIDQMQADGSYARLWAKYVGE